jgi:hypothetical protein
MSFVRSLRSVKDLFLRKTHADSRGCCGPRWITERTGAQQMAIDWKSRLSFPTLSKTVPYVNPYPRKMRRATAVLWTSSGPS